MPQSREAVAHQAVKDRRIQGVGDWALSCSVHHLHSTLHNTRYRCCCSLSLIYPHHNENPATITTNSVTLEAGLAPFGSFLAMTILNCQWRGAATSLGTATKPSSTHPSSQLTGIQLAECLLARFLCKYWSMYCNKLVVTSLREQQSSRKYL